MRGAEFGDAERERSHQLLVRVEEIARNVYVEQRGVGGNLTLMFVLVMVRGDQIGAIDGAIDGDFALGAATDGADFFAFGRAEAIGFALSTNGAEHGKQNTLWPHKKQKRRRLIAAGKEGPPAACVVLEG